MSVADLLNQYQITPPVTADCKTESDWYQYWHSQQYNQLPSAQIALKGGVHASNLAYVFIAGYQAAVRSVFPELAATGWAALAASEDKHDPVANPPVVAKINADGIELNGTKSWLAQSKNVDHLIVTAHTENGDLITAIVDRHQASIDITHRDSPSFLGDMSQGFARFNQTTIKTDACVTDNRLKTFMKTESKFVMLALTGWFFSQCLQQGSKLSSAFYSLVTDYAQACENQKVKVIELARLDTQLQELFIRFENELDTGAISNWQHDKTLVSMYSKGLQKRAAKQ